MIFEQMFIGFLLAINALFIYHFILYRRYVFDRIDRLEKDYKKAAQVAINAAKIKELEAIAIDMRFHPEYKGYVETSASGKWQPLSKRIKQLKRELK